MVVFLVRAIALTHSSREGVKFQSARVVLVMGRSVYVLRALASLSITVNQENLALEISFGNFTALM